MNIKYISAVIFVKDIKTSREFYENILDQQVEVDFGANVGFVGGFAIWQVERATEFIFEKKLEETNKMGRRNMELYFESEDIEGAWGKISDARIETVHPVKEHPWGQRVFRVYDPDGHIVEVGEPMPAVVKRMLNMGMSAESVSQKSMMPIEMVKAVADGQL